MHMIITSNPNPNFYIFLAWERDYVLIACLSFKSHWRILPDSFPPLAGERKVLPIHFHFPLWEFPILRFFLFHFKSLSRVSLALDKVTNIQVLHHHLIPNAPERWSTYPVFHRTNPKKILEDEELFLVLWVLHVDIAWPWRCSGKPFHTYRLKFCVFCALNSYCPKIRFICQTTH